MGWKMVRHAFVMVFGNLPQAIRASLVPILVGGVLTFVSLRVLGVKFSDLKDLQPGAEIDPAVAGALFPTVVLLLIIYLFVFGWIAVTWHRFILLEEYPTAIPVISGRPIWSYVGKVVLIGLITSLMSVPLFFVIGLFIAPWAASENAVAVAVIGSVAGIVMGTALTWVWYRFAIALPATAVGRKMGLSEGWAITKPASKDIFALALILVGLNVVSMIVLSPIANGMPIVGDIISLIINWITLMVGASVLTTLYGHLVEGRPLVD